MKRTGFLEGAFIAYVAIIISKVLGALYSIPFYKMVGDEGGVIYSCAYNIYALFLDISTCGIPIAVSIAISEYNAKGMYRSKERAYRIAFVAVAVVSLLSFVLLQIFAGQIGAYFMKGMTEGVTAEQVASGIRAVSTCLLIAPFLSLKRGYLQGHKILAPTSTSQMLEQIVRIAVVLGGAYLAIYKFDKSKTFAVCIALTGAAVGALAAYVYLEFKYRRNRFLFSETEEKGIALASRKEIARKIGSYCLTIVIVSVANSVYGIVDMKMLLSGLHNLHYADQQVQVIASISSTWIPKICMIITALSMGLTTSLAPHMAESRAKGEMEKANHTLNQAVSALLMIAVPIAGGMMLLAEPLFRLFYGYNDFGAGILQVSTVVTVMACVATTVGMSMQSMQRGKMVCMATICGIIANAGLDLPLIYLFDAIGIPAYLGAPTASVVGQLVAVTILMVSLHRSCQFSFMPIFRNVLRIILPMAAMLLAVYGIRYVWPIVETRGVRLVLQLVAFAVVGAIVYFALCLLTGAVSGAVGDGFVQKLREKFLPRKKK